MTARLMEEITWPEVREAAEHNVPVVVSVGSTEQHGPHLPLATDAILPVEVAKAAAEHVPLLIAPPIHYGARSRALSGGGEGFPGTLSLRASTLMNTAEEVVLALSRSGLKQICVQNWHYENAGFLWEACDRAVDGSTGARILLLENPMPEFSQAELDDLFPGGFPGWDVEHASIMETSMMMAVRPDLVRTHRIIDDEAQRHPKLGRHPRTPRIHPRQRRALAPDRLDTRTRTALPTSSRRAAGRRAPNGTRTAAKPIGCARGIHTGKRPR